MKGYEGMSFKRGGENDAGVGNSSSKTKLSTDLMIGNGFNTLRPKGCPWARLSEQRKQA